MILLLTNYLRNTRCLVIRRERVNNLIPCSVQQLEWNMQLEIASLTKSPTLLTFKNSIKESEYSLIKIHE